MHGTESTNANRSKIACGTFAAGTSHDGKSAVDDANWFAEMARDLLAPKAGTALHFITDFPERDCQKYAAGSIRPSAYYLRRMLRNKLGWQFLAYLMDGSDAPWWDEVLRAKRIAAAVDREI